MRGQKTRDERVWEDEVHSRSTLKRSPPASQGRALRERTEEALISLLEARAIEDGNVVATKTPSGA